MKSNIKLNYPSMKDTELLRILNDENATDFEKNKVRETLFTRYELQIHKNWLRLCAQLDNTQLVHDMKEDYYGEANIEFFRAISKIDLSRVRDDNFKCVGMVNWYLKNLRAKLIKQALKKNRRITTTNYFSLIEDENSNEMDSNIEMTYWDDEGYMQGPEYALEMKESEKNCEKALNKCIKKWTPFENQIYNLLIDGKSRKEIAEITKTDVSKIYSVSNSMKSDMKKALGM